MKKCFVTVMSFLALAFSQIAQAQVIDTRNTPIEVVIPFAPGGAATQVGQFVVKVLRDNGYNAVAINKPGNNSIIAGNYVAKSDPTGHTLFIGTTSSLAGNTAFRAQQIDIHYTDASFTPVILLNQSGLGLVVAADGPIKTYDQFKLWAKKNPDKFNLGTYNSVFGHLFKDWARREGLPEPNIILYKGSAAMMTDIVNGALLATFDNFGWGAPMLPMLESGKLSLLATFDNTATKEINKIKNTIADLSRIHSDLKFSVWLGLFAPVNTPPDVVKEFNRLINAAVTDPKNRDLVSAMDGIGGTPEHLGILVRRDVRTLTRLVK